MKIAVISDIHGNLSALQELNNQIREEKINGIILLGDLIDYGPRSNEVISVIKKDWNKLILVNIWGNHEYSIMNDDYSHFSSQRGVNSAKYTKINLKEDSISYLKQMETAGYKEFTIGGKNCLAIHGSIEDVFWKSIECTTLCNGYQKYDYVFSGHSHIPHYHQKFYESDNKEYRNKKRTVFINPGSLGQPRNHNPCGQFVTMDMDSEEIRFNTIEYDVDLEQTFYNEKIDLFYKERLKKGI